MNPERLHIRSIRIFAFGAAAVVIIALAAGYLWWGGHFSSRPSGPAATLDIANTAYFGLALAYIAQDRNLFEAENLTVNFHPYQSGKAALGAVLEGKADLATSADLPVMFAVNAGRPVTVIAMVSKADKDLGLVVRRDRGITRVREIKGKRIGVTLGTAGHFTLSGFLLSRRMTMADIVVKNLTPDELIAQLSSGDLDGVVTWEPYLNKAQSALGDRGNTYYAEDLYNDQFMLAGLRPVVEGKKEAIIRLLRALKKAESIYSADPQSSYAIISNRTGLPLELVQRLMPSYQISLELGQSLIMSLEDETRWAVQNRLIEGGKMPNFMDHLALEPMLAVKANAVTIVH